MSTPDPYEQYRAALGAELRRVAPTVRRQRRRRFVALGGATVGLAAVGTAVVVLAPTTGSKLDVIAQARAAIAPSTDSIVHYSLSFTTNYPTRKIDDERWKGCGVAAPIEVWTATTAGPPRYRYRMPQNRCIVNQVGQGRIATGDLELAYADRTSKLYAPNDGFELDTTGLPAGADEQGPPLPIADSRFSDADPRDPVAKIRSMLNAGQLRDAGTVRGPDGKELHKLVGKYLVNRGDPANPRKSPVSVVYEVDATTFAPVLVSTTAVQSVPKNPDLPMKHLIYVHRNITDKVRFASYETLPLTPENEQLLTVDPKPGTDVKSTAWSSKVSAVQRPDAAEKARAKKILDAQVAAGTRKPGYDLDR